ncbi:hypothetical protein [Rhizorhabdus sp.]|uniref:hypothetical protein n=1 Tax=Rhizorhabdus sp. TaxID=1968843 RepID=UPI0035B46447
MSVQYFSLLLSFLKAPSLLLGGSVGLLTILPSVALLLFLGGVALAIAWREKQVVWLLPPLLASLAAPLVLEFADSAMGWFGMLFALTIGLVGLVVWIGMVAGNATRRTPVVLAGLSLLAFPAYAGLFRVAVTWGGT